MRRLVAGIAAGLFITSAAVLLASDGEAETESVLPAAPTTAADAGDRHRQLTPSLKKKSAPTASTRIATS